MLPVSCPSRYRVLLYFLFFFLFNDTATTEIYTLSLHDALPICSEPEACRRRRSRCQRSMRAGCRDRKSTRLNSSHVSESRMPSSALKKKNNSPGWLGLTVTCQFGRPLP